MSKIIDYLAVNDSVLSFQANNAADYVDSLPLSSYLENGAGRRTFQAGDYFILSSYGIMLPENFTFYGPFGLPVMEVYGWVIPALLGFTLPVFQRPAVGFNPSLLITEENKEHPIEGFCDYNQFKIDVSQAPVTTNFILQAPIGVCHISMLNVPDDANLKVYRIVPFVKVIHNLPLL